MSDSTDLATSGLELQTSPVPRTRVIAWAFWDWAAQPYNTVILSFVWAPLYLQNVDIFAAPGQTQDDLASQFGLIIGLGAFVIAILAPVLGQRADVAGNRKRWLAFWTGLLVVSTASLFFVQPEPAFFVLGAVLVAVANIMSELANVNYYSMLTQVSTPTTVGRVSGLGWGFGYIGGVIMLVVVAGFSTADWFGLDATMGLRIVALGCAVWTVVFCIPLFLAVPEAPANTKRERVGFFRSYVVLIQDIRKLWRESRSTVWFLLASAVYRDGLTGVFTFASVIAISVFSFGSTTVLIFGIVANLVAGLSTIASGRLDDRFGARAVITGSLIGLVAVGVLVFALRGLGSPVFWVGGLILAACVGPAQTASRSLLTRLVPAGREGEVFGLYATTGRAASPLSPLVWAAFVAIGGVALGIVGIVLIIAIGLVLFLFVKLPPQATGGLASTPSAR